MPASETSTSASAIRERLVAKVDFIELTTDRVVQELEVGTSKEVLEWAAIREHKFVEAIRRDPHADAQCWAAFGEFERVVLALVKSSPWDEDDLAPELVDATERLRLLMEEDSGLRDPEWKIRETMDRIDDLFRTMVRRVERQMIDDPRVASRWIVMQLYPNTGEGLTCLAGVDERALMRFAESAKRSKGLNPERIVLVAQLIYDLRDFRDKEGILLWFTAPRYQLDNRSPLQLLEEDVGAANEPLRSLARGGRGQIAT